MAKQLSAGLLMYRIRESSLEVFLVHPGGPYFARKDDGYWSIPKGLVEGEEDLLEAAQREFEEETGIQPAGPFIPLGSVKQRSGKVVHAWAFRGDWDSAQGLRSNTFQIEWPPRSGKRRTFPEIDRASFFSPADAAVKMHAEQAEFLDRLKGELT